MGQIGRKFRYAGIVKDFFRAFYLILCSGRNVHTCVDDVFCTNVCNLKTGPKLTVSSIFPPKSQLFGQSKYVWYRSLIQGFNVRNSPSNRIHKIN